MSHDAHYLPDSISRYYKYVDEIVIGLDKSRTSWVGNKFSFDEDKVFLQLKNLDIENKIKIVEEDFCIPEFVSCPINNDNYERNILRHHCSHETIISIDADEILYNTEAFFTRYLPISYKYLHDYDICFYWITPYKLINDVVLLICNHDGSPCIEQQAVVSHKSNPFTYARYSCVSADGSNRLASNLVSLHWGLARKQEDLDFKIKNQGHSAEDDGSFYEVWKQINLQNYQGLVNFKPSHVGGPSWDRLVAIPRSNLDKVINASAEHITKPTMFSYD